MVFRQQSLSILSCVFVFRPTSLRPQTLRVAVNRGACGTVRCCLFDAVRRRTPQQGSLHFAGEAGKYVSGSRFEKVCDAPPSCSRLCLPVESIIPQMTGSPQCKIQLSKVPCSGGTLRRSTQSLSQRHIADNRRVVALIFLREVLSPMAHRTVVRNRAYQAGSFNTVERHDERNSQLSDALGRDI